MSEDNLYLLFCYIIYGLTLTFLTVKNKSRAKTVLINLTILFGYSGLFIYNLNFNSAGGSGLVWLVYLMFALGVHWFVNLIGLVRTFITTTKSKETWDYNLNNTQDFWKIFDQLIKLLKTDNKTEIIAEFKDAQKYVNGLTDGWYEFKFAFEKVLKSNRQNMTAEQNNIAEFLLTRLNKSFRSK